MGNQTFNETIINMIIYWIKPIILNGENGGNKHVKVEYEKKIIIKLRKAQTKCFYS